MDSKVIFDTILTLFKQSVAFANWLFKPIGHGIDIAPIAIFTLGGFAVVFVLHVIHLVNPVG